jgi:hypothetical protein
VPIHNPAYRAQGPIGLNRTLLIFDAVKAPDDLRTLDFRDWPCAKDREDQSAQEALTRGQSAKLAAFPAKVFITDAGEAVTLRGARITALGKSVLGFEGFSSGGSNASCGIRAESEPGELPVPPIEEDPTSMGRADTKGEARGVIVEEVGLDLARLRLGRSTEPLG